MFRLLKLKHQRNCPIYTTDGRPLLERHPKARRRGDKRYGDSEPTIGSWATNHVHHAYLLATLKRQKLRKLETRAVPYGFRSSFHDWAAEETDIRARSRM